MRLTTKGRYGVRAMAKLAAAGEAQERPVSITQIADEEQLSPEFLEQIFFKLKKAGVIRSIRGPKGGFVLNRRPEEITVAAILDAVGEPLYPAPCTDGNAKGCARKDGCAMAPVWGEFHTLIRRHLAGISLRDILDSHGGATAG